MIKKIENPTKEDFKRLLKNHNINATDVCKLAGFAPHYSYHNYRPCLYYTALHVIAGKKGVSLEAVLNV